MRPNRAKPSGLMAEMATAKKSKTVLLGDIQTHAVKKSAEESDRRQDIIHPSEMAKEDWCPRATAYRISGAQPTNPARVHGLRLLTIFQEGHDQHSKWQNWLAEMGRLWGKWECPSCGHARLGTAPQVCNSLSHVNVSLQMDYREIPLDGEASHMIAGHSDGGVPDIDSMIEVKTIGLGTLRMEEPSLVSKHTHKTVDGKTVVDADGLWKAIKRPLLSHRKQAGIYLFLAQQMGLKFDQMVFIYEFKANQDTKEFAVKYDEELIQPLLDKALDIKWAVDNNRVLPRPTEFEKDAKPCTECPFRDLCWGERNDGEDRDQEPHAADGVRVPGGEEETRPAADRRPAQARGRSPRTTGRPHRPGRQRADASVRPADEVGGVPEHPVGSGRGRRTVRRRRTGEDQGH